MDATAMAGPRRAGLAVDAVFESVLVSIAVTVISGLADVEAAEPEENGYWLTTGELRLGSIS